MLAMPTIRTAILLYSATLTSVSADVDGGSCSGDHSRSYTAKCTLNDPSVGSFTAEAASTDWYTAAKNASPVSGSDFGCSPPANTWWEGQSIGKLGSKGNVKFYHQLSAKSGSYFAVVANVFIVDTDNDKAMYFCNYWPSLLTQYTWDCTCTAE